MEYRQDLQTFATADIEASLNSSNEFDFVLGTIVDAEKEYHINSIEEFMEVSNKIKKPIYFHNLDFDILFFIKSYLLHDNINIITSGNMMLKIKIEKTTFLNSLAIFPMSLKKIVKNFLHINDLEWENDKNNVLTIDNETLKKYCLKDSRYLYNALYKIKKVMKDNYNIDNFLTIPSLSMKVFRNNFAPKNFFNKSFRNPFFDEGYYFGGHTEKFISNQYFFEKVEYYDVNSLYPSIMRDTYFNTGKPKIINPTKENILKLIQEDKIFYTKILINVDTENLRIFPQKIKQSNKYKFGLQTVKVSDISIKFLIKNNFFDKIIQVEELFYYETKLQIFKNFVETFYALRKSDIGNDLIYKLILNALYGKFGMKKIVDKIIINPIDKKITPTKIVQMHNNHLVSYKEEINTPQTVEILRKDIAGRVTEGARVLMSQYRLDIKKLGIKVFYQDTDSLMINKRLEDTTLKNLISSSTLGLLKRENKQTLQGYLIGSKVYYLYNNIETKQANKGVKNMKRKQYIELFLKISLKNMSFKTKQTKNYTPITQNTPNNLFYNERFSKLKTLFSKSFFGIQIVPHEINKITERND